MENLKNVKQVRYYKMIEEYIKNYADNNPGKYLCIHTIADESGFKFEDIKRTLFDMYYSGRSNITLNFDSMRFHAKKVEKNE